VPPLRVRVAAHRSLPTRRPRAGYPHFSATEPGNIAYNRGDPARARPLLEEGLAVQRAAGDRRGVAWAAGYLGRALATAGEAAAARPLLEERLAICRADGERLGESLALWFLADLAFDQGRREEAAALRRQALALGQELDDRTYVAPQLEGFGEAAAAAGDVARALRLAGAAAALREANGTPPAAPEQVRLERWLAPVVAAAGADVRARMWAEGHGMTREAAVAYALADAAATP
jgi:tetratricopeptide (TPR) repeat protein